MQAETSRNLLNQRTQSSSQGAVTGTYGHNMMCCRALVSAHLIRVHPGPTLMGPLGFTIKYIEHSMRVKDGSSSYFCTLQVTNRGVYGEQFVQSCQSLHPLRDYRCNQGQVLHRGHACDKGQNPMEDVRLTKRTARGETFVASRRPRKRPLATRGDYSYRSMHPTAQAHV